MVFFSCSVCGESMKKNQVEKHCALKCRNCQFLSCVDCGKEFWGNEYAKHIKCMSEEEKTHGALYKKDPNANKGEQKQENWVQQVHAAISKVKGNPSLTRLLEKLKDYPNIPRKKVKFENFVKNSLRITDNQLLCKAWDAISNELEVQKAGENSKENVSSHEVQKEDETILSNHKESFKTSNETSNQKRKPDLDEIQPDSKKQKLHPEAMKDGLSNKILEKQEKEKTLCTKQKTVGHCDQGNDPANEQNASSQSKWKSSIIEILKETHGNIMPLKKLQKMVLARMKRDTNMTKEEMKKKFNYKLERCSRVKINDSIVTLCS